MKRICGTIVVLGLAVFLFLTTAPVASAQQAGPFYVGVFGGFVMPDDLRWSQEHDYYHYNGYGYDESLEDSWAVGVKVGYIIPQIKSLAFELEYTYLAEQDYKGDNGLDGDFSAHNLMANLLFRYPLGKIHPYVGFGLGLSRGTIEENSTFNSYHFDEDDTAFASQFIAGLNFEITPNWSADLAYKYFYSEYEMEADWDAEANNHIFSLGVNYHF